MAPACKAAGGKRAVHQRHLQCSAPAIPEVRARELNLLNVNLMKTTQDASVKPTYCCPHGRAGTKRTMQAEK